MSSTIYYDKAYIRVDDGFIPVVNHGESNVFAFDQQGRKVAEKHWSVLSYPYLHKLLFSKEEMLEIAENCEQINIDVRGGIRKSRNHAFEEGEFQRWILKGIEYAHTVEEYTLYGNTVQVVDYGDNYRRYPVRTTEELLETLEKLKTSGSIGVTFSNDRHVQKSPARKKTGGTTNGK